MKRICAVLGLVVSLGVLSATAQAATLQLNDSVTQALSDNDVGVMFGQHDNTASFLDAFKFSLTGTSDIVTFGFVPQGTFSNLTVKLYNSSAASYVAPAAGVPVTTSYTFAGLTTGSNYQFEISGLATSSIAAYIGSATVSAVPLPAALPLFAAALAALGFAMRRRTVAQAI